MMPESFEYAKNGGRKYLFHNLGDGSFEDVSAKRGHRQPALGAGGRGGRPARHRLSGPLRRQRLRRLGAVSSTTGKQFREVGKQTGVGFAPKSGMNVSFGDVLNQGRFAIYVSNISEEGVLIQGNNLWVPKEGTAGDAIAVREPGARWASSSAAGASARSSAT